LWYLFRVAPGALLLQLRQLLIFAAAAARAPTPPAPFFRIGPGKSKLTVRESRKSNKNPANDFCYGDLN
jgi:hypothetical protein